MLIYQQLPERNILAYDHDEGTGGGGGGADRGIMIYMQLFFVVQPLISIQCLLRFRLVCPIIYFHLKILSFLSGLIDQYFYIL